MSGRGIFMVVGAIISVVVGVVISMLASAIEQQGFANLLSGQSIVILGSLAIIGTLLGGWLGTKLHLPFPSPASSPDKPDILTITRLRAILSYSRLKGKGIHLSDIMLIGSHVDIDTTP